MVHGVWRSSRSSTDPFLLTKLSVVQPPAPDASSSAPDRTRADSRTGTNKCCKSGARRCGLRTTGWSPMSCNGGTDQSFLPQRKVSDADRIHRFGRHLSFEGDLVLAKEHGLSSVEVATGNWYQAPHADLPALASSADDRVPMQVSSLRLGAERCARTATSCIRSKGPQHDKVRRLVEPSNRDR